LRAALHSVVADEDGVEVMGSGEEKERRGKDGATRAIGSDHLQKMAELVLLGLQVFA
jgi:hypothetical protein